MPLTFAGDVVRSVWTLCDGGGVLTLVQGGAAGAGLGTDPDTCTRPGPKLVT